MKLISLVFLCTAVLLASGCKHDDPTADTGAPATPSNAPKAPGDNVAGKAKEVQAPPAATGGGGGYRITPSNPNDPHFKADPKLAGGG